MLWFIHWYEGVVLFHTLLLTALAADAGPAVPLLPREALLAPAQRVDPKLSPDGKRIAWLSPDASFVNQVWARALDTQATVQLTQGPSGALRFDFTPDSQGLLVTQSFGTEGQTHVSFVDLNSSQLRDLTPWPGVRAELLRPTARLANTVLISMNRRDPQSMDVWRINVKTGAADLDTVNPGDVQLWLVDPTLVVSGAVATTAEGGTEVRLRDGAKAPWRPFISVGLEETIQVFDFTADRRALLLGTTISGDTLRIVEKNLKSGTERVLAAHETRDPLDIWHNRSRNLIQAVAFQDGGHQDWRSLDFTVTADLELLQQRSLGEFSVVSVDAAEQKWLVALSQDVAPARYVLFERKTKVSTNLFSTMPRLETASLAAMTPVSFTARDGLPLTGFLTLPPWPASARPPPLVVLVHDGPWLRDRLGFHAPVQLLANRGYAVLQVNFRGSAGSGKRFMQAGFRQWGLSMNTDVLDGIKAVEGQVDTSHMAVMGQGYGGFAALSMLETAPEVFRCGVEAFAPLSLLTMLAAPVSRGSLPKPTLIRRVGNPAESVEQAQLVKVSPLAMADKIRVPVLAAHGAFDPHVTQAEVERLVAAVKPHLTLVTYPGERDDFTQPENRFDFYARVEAFLAQCLGGRFEPVVTKPTETRQ